MDTFVNGDRVDFEEQSRLDFNEVFIVNQNHSKIGIYFAIGVSIDITSIENFLTYQISIPKRFKGNYYCLFMQDFSEIIVFIYKSGKFSNLLI